MTIGRASYEPGWKWSEHVGAATGAKLCEVEHVGMVVSGCAACRMQDGRYHEMRAGDLFISARATTAGWSATSPMSRCIFSARNVTRSHTANKIPSVDFAKSYYAGFFGALSRLCRT